MVYKDSLDEKKRHFHFGEFLHFQFGTNTDTLNDACFFRMNLDRTSDFTNPPGFLLGGFIFYQKTKA